MAGKTKSQAQLHKTKSAAPKMGQNAFSKLANSCNEQVQQIQAMLHQAQESAFLYNKRHSALKSRADAIAQGLYRSSVSTGMALKNLLGHAEGAQKKLEDAKHSVHDSENGRELEELIFKMQSSVDQTLVGLGNKGAGKMKKQRQANGAGKGRGGKK